MRKFYCLGSRNSLFKTGTSISKLFKEINNADTSNDAVLPTPCSPTSSTAYWSQLRRAGSNSSPKPPEACLRVHACPPALFPSVLCARDVPLVANSSSQPLGIEALLVIHSFLEGLCPFLGRKACHLCQPSSLGEEVNSLERKAERSFCGGKP